MGTFQFRQRYISGSTKPDTQGHNMPWRTYHHYKQAHSQAEHSAVSIPDESKEETLYTLDNDTSITDLPSMDRMYTIYTQLLTPKGRIANPMPYNVNS